MRILFSILFLLTATLSFSQTRNIKVNITLQKLTSDTLKISLNSQTENLSNCSIHIVDTSKKIIRMAEFPKPWKKNGIKQWTEVSVPISDLRATGYTYILYMGKELMHKEAFSKK
jgi:hypothetical protein